MYHFGITHCFHDVCGFKKLVVTLDTQEERTLEYQQ